MQTDLSGQPLDELKQWLAISTNEDDALLIRLLEAAWQVCRQFTGMTATSWEEAEDGLRHGIVRHAAHQYRERDAGLEGGSYPPAAVAALWRPWRTLRLS